MWMHFSLMNIAPKNRGMWKLKLIILFFFLWTMTQSTWVNGQVANVRDWTLAAELHSAAVPGLNHGIAGPVAGIAGDKFIIGGGANFPDNFPWKGGQKKYYNHLLVYDMRANGLQLLSDCITLPHSIAYAGLAGNNDGFFAVGGEDENGLLRSAYFFSWNKKNRCLQTESLPELPEKVTNGSLVHINGTLYFAGGETTAGTSARLWKLSLKEMAGWEEMQPLPVPASHGVFVALDHETLAWASGRRKTETGISEIYNGLYIYDIRRNAWTKKSSLPVSLAAGTGATDGQGNMLIFGGDDGSTFSRVEAALVKIAEAQTPDEKEEWTDRKNALQENHPGFNPNIYLWNRDSDTWSSAGKLPFETPVTTTAIPYKNRIFLPSGEIRAGVRTNKVWMTKR